MLFQVLRGLERLDAGRDLLLLYSNFLELCTGFPVNPVLLFSHSNIEVELPLPFSYSCKISVHVRVCTLIYTSSGTFRPAVSAG